MTPLTDLLPPAVRRWVYAVLTLAMLVWTLYQASDGDWRQFVGGLLLSLTTGMAASNVPTPPVEG